MKGKNSLNYPKFGVDADNCPTLIATIVYKRQKSPLICTGVVDLDQV